MKVLLTGASGFLGLNIARELRSRDYQVRAQSFTGAGNALLEGLDLEIVTADITRLEDVHAMVKDQELVIHTAGDTSFWNQGFARQREINVAGCENLARACVEAGVRRLVHISTVDVFGHDPNGLVDESWQGYSYSGWKYNYADTKREGEAALREILRDKVELVIVYPGGLLGPLDRTQQFGRIFFDLRDGKLPGVPPGGTCFAHVGEVARVTVEAAERGVPGEGYICAGTKATYRELFDAMAAKMAAKSPRLTMPRFMMLVYAHVVEWISRFTRKAPDINPGMARYMSAHAYYDSTKATRELGFQQFPLQELVDAEYNWYAENGYF